MICPECGTVLENHKTCEDYFYQMLFWEAENPGYGEVHHLTVLSYYLQHPSLYSEKGLEKAIRLLTIFVAEEITPQAARKRMLAEFESTGNKPKITATADSVGVYQGQVFWDIRAVDVIAAGANQYCKSVKNWAQSILKNLKETGNYKNI